MLHDSCVLVPHPTAAVVSWCVDSVGSQSCRSRELSWARPCSWADSGSGRDNTTLQGKQMNGQTCYISDASSWHINVHIGTQCIQWLWPAKWIHQLNLVLHILSTEALHIICTCCSVLTERSQMCPGFTSCHNLFRSSTGWSRYCN